MLVMRDTIVMESLYLSWEVRNDEEATPQLAASTGVMARPGFVARAGDRRS
jgi:hypothetical protein